VTPLAEAGTAVGRYTTNPAIEGGFLPISMRPLRHDPASPVVVVVGLDLQWLALRLDELQARLHRAPRLANTVLFLTDGDGTILARYPAAPKQVGHSLPPDLLPLVARASPGSPALAGRTTWSLSCRPPCHRLASPRSLRCRWPT
jgi:hypothetical protein